MGSSKHHTFLVNELHLVFPGRSRWRPPPGASFPMSGFPAVEVSASERRWMYLLSMTSSIGRDIDVKLNDYSQISGSPILLLVFSYPLMMKRITSWDKEDGIEIWRYVKGMVVLHFVDIMQRLDGHTYAFLTAASEKLA
ncbi:hypothetical protein MLD38_014012 [Melastoma candidum]|uniref:Uncharacterized protein n=1 Tax=Melastoma candidum TaxID=119954 RepID=A0ACB9RD95_9MYRT|nr:hypothetical protein MLD38_014012 [Melastoma candidum]